MGMNTSGTSRCRHRILRAVIAMTLGLCGVQATSWANQAGAAGAPVAAAEGARRGNLPSPGSTASQAAPQPSSVDQTYAAREASAKDLAQFKGGDVVIVGSTGLIIVLLVILILVIA
jgi:hypothetical protein